MPGNKKSKFAEYDFSIDCVEQMVSLERNGFSRLAAARELGIHKTTLFRRMKKLGILLPERDGRTK